MQKALAGEHVIGPLIAALRKRGLDVATVIDLGLKSEDDSVLLARALDNQCLLLTNDTDFLALAAECHSRSEVFAPILFWPQQQRSIGYLIGRIVSLASRENYAELCSQVFFL